MASIFMRVLSLGATLMMIHCKSPSHIRALEDDQSEISAASSDNSRRSNYSKWAREAYDALNRHFYNGSQGLFEEWPSGHPQKGQPGLAFVWPQAVVLNALIESDRVGIRLGDTASVYQRIHDGYGAFYNYWWVYNAGHKNPNVNYFYDDNGIIAWAALDYYRISKNPAHLHEADVLVQMLREGRNDGWPIDRGLPWQDPGVAERHKIFDVEQDVVFTKNKYLANHATLLAAVAASEIYLARRNPSLNQAYVQYSNSIQGRKTLANPEEYLAFAKDMNDAIFKPSNWNMTYPYDYHPLVGQDVICGKDKGGKFKCEGRNDFLRAYATLYAVQLNLNFYRIYNAINFLKKAQLGAEAVAKKWLIKGQNGGRCFAEAGEWGGFQMVRTLTDLYRIDHDKKWLFLVKDTLEYLRKYRRDPATGLYKQNWCVDAGDDLDPKKRDNLIYTASAAYAFSMVADPSLPMP